MKMKFLKSIYFKKEIEIINMLKQVFNELLNKKSPIFNKGSIITFEGINNTGKSTSIEHVEKYLKGCGISYIKFKFPDLSTSSGKLLKQHFNNQQMFTPIRVHNLFLQNIQEKQNEILLSLDKYQIILIDRYLHSTIAYSVARGLNIQQCIKSVESFIKPDLIIYYNKRYKIGDENWENYLLTVSNIFERIIPYIFDYTKETQVIITINLIQEFINYNGMIINYNVYSSDIFYILQYINNEIENTFYNFNNLIYRYTNKKRNQTRNIFVNHWIPYFPIKLREINLYDKEKINNLVKEYQNFTGFLTLEEYTIMKEENFYIKSILKSSFYVPKTVEELIQLTSIINNDLFTKLINSRFGDYHEPKAIKLYGEIFNIPVFYNNTDKSFKKFNGNFYVSGKIDGLALIKNKVVLLEVKTKINKFSYKIYKAHYLQIQACLWITDLNEARLIQYYPSSDLNENEKFKVDIIKRDDKFITIFCQLKNFLKNIISFDQKIVSF